MINSERSKYKSWSNLKKQMSDLLCDSLKDKISYFFTGYHEVHNSYGRATVNYNKKEMAAFSWVERYEQEREVSELFQVGANVSEEKLEKEKRMPECILCDFDFVHAITVYLKTDVSTALNSDNYLLRIFAYMDRRVGKRTLIRIRDTVNSLPEWVKQFYRIRCEAEGIFCTANNIHFRIAKNSEAEELYALYRSVAGTGYCVWDENYPGMADVKRDLATENVYVLSDGDNIVGAVSAEVVNDLDGFDCWECNDGTQREIARVVISKDRQGMGLSCRLVEEISKILRNKGCNTIHLAVAKTNIPAYKLYIKTGFKLCGEAEIYGGYYCLMEKLLSDSQNSNGKIGK